MRFDGHTIAAGLKVNSINWRGEVNWYFVSLPLGIICTRKHTNQEHGMCFLMPASPINRIEDDVIAGLTSAILSICGNL